jgi:hypothetical protein
MREKLAWLQEINRIARHIAQDRRRRGEPVWEEPKPDLT